MVSFIGLYFIFPDTEIYEQKIVPLLTVVHDTEVLEKILGNFQYVTFTD